MQPGKARKSPRREAIKETSMRPDAAASQPTWATDVLQHLGDGLVVLDANGEVTFANPEAFRLHGIEPADGDGDRLSYLGLLLRSGWAETWGQFPALPPAERTPELCWQVRRQDGGRTLIRGVLSPLREHGGTIASLREDFDRSGDLDPATLQFWEQFTGILGHDVRTPLTAVRGSASLLLRDGATTETIQRNAQRVLDNTDRLLRLFRDLVDFTRSRLRASLAIAPTYIDLVDATKKAAARVEAAYPGRPIELRCPLDMWGEWDRERIEQLLLCLMENAVLHSPDDSEVRVLLERKHADTLLEIRNTAPILSESAMDTLFDPFHTGREGRRASRLSGGIGLGLFVARQIVEAHGGSVKVISSTEDGTCVRIRLHRSTEPSTGAGPQRLETRRTQVRP